MNSFTSQLWKCNMSDRWPTSSNIGCSSVHRVSRQPWFVPAGQFKFHLICSNSQPSSSSPSSSLRHVVRHYMFSYSLCETLRLRSVPGFYQTHLSHFPRCPRAAFHWPLRISNWLFPYITSPHPPPTLITVKKRNPTYFLSTQSFRGHSSVLDIWPPNSCTLPRNLGDLFW